MSLGISILGTKVTAPTIVDISKKCPTRKYQGERNKPYNNMEMCNNSIQKWMKQMMNAGLMPTRCKGQWEHTGEEGRSSA